MNSSCTEDVSVPDDDWYRITSELLSHTGIVINGSAPADIRVESPNSFKHVLQEGSLGLGESCMDGWWECDRLDMFLSKVLRTGLENQLPRHFKDTLCIATARLFNLQTKKHAWMVGKEHYDLGDDLFTRMLDPHMQYPRAYWKNANTLESTQQAKLKMIAGKLQLKPGMRVLDIGYGWGSSSQFMASQYGVSVVGVAISAEQQKMAQERCAGLDVTILLQDYRDLNDKLDRTVPVGMFEHVGPKNYATCSEVVDRNLKPDGLFLLHSIGSKKIDNNIDPWIDKYTFPNECLSSVRQAANASEPHFVMEDWHNFDADYDTTLIAWHEYFMNSWPEIADNYAERFKRMFSYYLNACAEAFRVRDIQLWQVIFSRGVEHGLRVPR